MSYTEREREILDSWPTVTAQDLTTMNDLFAHYLFYNRADDLMGLGEIHLWASCCGHKEVRPYLTRTQDQEHWTLMDLGHKDRLTCPWCGREVTAIDLSRAKGRKSLRQTELTVLIHAKGDALYADALVLYKDYADEAALTAGPVAWCSSGYRFVQGEVMQVGSPENIYKKPQNTFVAGFIGVSNFVECDVNGENPAAAVLDIKGECTITCSLKAPFKGKGIISARPEQLFFDEKEGLPGKIVISTFLGDFIEYEIELDNGQTVQLNEYTKDVRELRPDGQRVKVNFDINAVGVYDAGTQEVISW